ncbi:MAG TPA: hypothetical protein PLP17_03405, partial [Oligoflexia bacterium]|nr:hypothetical protein [Oligoflexia bacterium]
MQQRHKLLAQLHGNGALPDQQEINTYVARAVNKSGTRGDTLDVLFAALDNSGTAEATGAELKRVIARHRGAAKRKALAADLGRWFYEKRVRGYQASSRRDDLLQRLRDALPEDAVEAFDQTVLRCAAKDQTAAAAVLALLHEIDPT